MPRSFDPRRRALLALAVVVAPADPLATTYDWDFGDGTTPHGAAPSVAHPYAAAGTYHVTLTTTEGGLFPAVVSADVVVDTPPTLSSIAVPSASPALGVAVSFSSDAADPDPGDGLSYAWDFGDGQTSTAATPKHAYVVPGSHTVSLTVTDSRGVSPSTVSQVIAVKADTAPTVTAGASNAAPAIGQPVSFFANPIDPDPGDSGSLVYAWDFGDGASSTAEDPVHAYSTAGVRTVTLRATDRWGAQGSDKTFEIVTARPVVGDKPPVASITATPTAPRSGQRVSLAAHASAPDGTVPVLAWDLDNDGVFGNDRGVSPDGKTAAVTFVSPGRHTVRLRATDNLGASTVVSRTVVVGDRPPVADFTFTPRHPRVGQRVSLVSLATDPDGPTLRPHWDLDGDGHYDDATGTLVARAFRTAGRHRVGITVTDSAGVTRVRHRTILVRPRSYPLLSPFPVVRISGIVSRRGARLTLVAVTAPRGTRIAIGCHGHGCPRRRAVRRGTGRSVRIVAFQRYLRAGIRLDVRVTRAGRVGKYMTFTIRSGHLPARRDRCLRPGGKAPVSCP